VFTGLRRFEGVPSGRGSRVEFAVFRAVEEGCPFVGGEDVGFFAAVLGVAHGDVPARRVADLDTTCPVGAAGLGFVPAGEVLHRDHLRLSFVLWAVPGTGSTVKAVPLPTGN